MCADRMYFSVLFFGKCEGWIASPLRPALQAFTYAIERSCINKAEVVAADEKEGGVRATLNLGHTFGHAIETCTGLRAWHSCRYTGISAAIHLWVPRRQHVCIFIHTYVHCFVAACAGLCCGCLTSAEPNLH